MMVTENISHKWNFMKYTVNNEKRIEKILQLTEQIKNMIYTSRTLSQKKTMEYVDAIEKEVIALSVRIHHLPNFFNLPSDQQNITDEIPLRNSNVKVKEPLMSSEETVKIDYKPRNAKPPTPSPPGGNKPSGLAEFDWKAFWSKPLNIQQRELNIRILNRNNTYRNHTEKSHGYSDFKKKEVEEKLRVQTEILEQTGMVKFDEDGYAKKNW